MLALPWVIRGFTVLGFASLLAFWWLGCGYIWFVMVFSCVFSVLRFCGFGVCGLVWFSFFVLLVFAFRLRGCRGIRICVLVCFAWLLVLCFLVIFRYFVFWV